MNYKHLHYFWTVLRAGGVVRASEQLHLTPQTLSGQIKQLEQRLGQPLLRKAGRGVEPTDAGRLVMRYADEIFALGASLQEALHSGRDLRRATVLRVGIADALPKAIAFHVLEPAMALPEPPQLVCHEGGMTSLLAELAVHRLDLVLSDVPAPARLSVKVYTHLLGRTGIAFFAAPQLLKAVGLTVRRPGRVRCTHRAGAGNRAAIPGDPAGPPGRFVGRVLCHLGRAAHLTPRCGRHHGGCPQQTVCARRFGQQPCVNWAAEAWAAPRWCLPLFSSRTKVISPQRGLITAPGWR